MVRVAAPIEVAPPIIATHFDLAALEAQVIAAKQAAFLARQRMKNAEALALILGISETLQ